MKVNNEKYLVISEYDTIDAKCSECSNAGITLHYCSNMREVVSKISEISFYGNVKIIGMYKAIDKITIDKNCNTEEVV